MPTPSKRNVTTLVPWFGSNRNQAADVGRALAGCRWVGIGFFGGGCEAAYIDATSCVANDLHGHVINLASVIGDPVLGPKLIRAVRRIPISDQVLEAAQVRCIQDEIAEEDEPSGGLFLSVRQAVEVRPPLARAIDYFTCSWQGRNGTAGQDNEFDGGVCVRYDAGGGDPVVRWNSARKALRSWQKIFRRYLFLNLDIFDFLDQLRAADEAIIGKPREEWELRAVYLDPPFPDAGDVYKHKFSIEDQRRLARVASRFKGYRVVMRFYDHPLVRELYPETLWHYQCRDGRDAHNKKKPELLLILKNDVSGLN